MAKPILNKLDHADWQDTIQHGDIVGFRFPGPRVDANGILPVSPCMVLNISERGGLRFAEIVLGVPWTSPANLGFEVRIRDNETLAACGLSGPTRFVPAKRTTVVLDHTGFVIPDGVKSPVIGRLTGKARERLNG